MNLDFLNKLTKKQKIITLSGVLVIVFIVIIIVVVASSGSSETVNIKDNSSNNNTNSVVDEGSKETSLPAVTNKENVSPISGLPCENYKSRPFAAMMAGDIAARPLSGLSEADMVFEMPVISGSITRLMGVFLCNQPEEIGSLRSARHDYITLAMGIDAIFVHWGGSHFALDDLKTGIADNIDALRHSSPFFRKSHVARPHNGFTGASKLIEKSTALGYRLENKFAGYPHLDLDETADTKSGTKGTLEVGFAGAYKVKYEYDPTTKAYKRFWNGVADKDYVNDKEILAMNVVVMKAASRQIEGQYNDVDIEGEGEIKVYLNGLEITGTWKKDKAKRDSKLYFLDENGQEIEFVPGQIWVEVIEPYQEVKWSS